MEIGYDLIVFCGRFSKYLSSRKPKYVVYGSKEALSLLNSSVEVLAKSECSDYFITKMGKKKAPEPPLVFGEFDVDGHTLVEKEVYDILFLDISQKLRELRRVGCKMR